MCTIEKGGMETRARDFRALFTHLVHAERFESGFRWAFRGDASLHTAVRELAAREHECCQFLGFVVSSEGDTVTWDVGGPPAAQEAVDMFYDLPRSVHGDVNELRQAAMRAGLSFSADGPNSPA